MSLFIQMFLYSKSTSPSLIKYDANASLKIGTFFVTPRCPFVMFHVQKIIF